MILAFEDYHDARGVALSKGQKIREVAFGYGKNTNHCVYWFLIYKKKLPAKAIIKKALLKAGFIVNEDSNIAY